MSNTDPAAAPGSGATPALKAGAAIAAVVAVAAGLYAYTQFGTAASRQRREAAAALRTEQQALREVDPELIEYREVGQVDTGFQEPRQITLAPDGSLYVAGDQAIRAFDPAGALTSEAPLAANPYCVAVDDSGALYVGFQGHVEVYGPAGDVRARWAPSGEQPYLTCVAVSGEDVWVADAGNRAVLHYDTFGRLLGRIGEKDDSRGIPGLLLPGPHLDVVVAPDGRLVVNNGGRWAVETYTAEGELQSSWGRGSQAIDGFCGCCNPTDIALLSDGRVVTSEKGLPRVKVYSPDGTLECVVAAPADFSVGTAGLGECASRGLDLAVDGDGRVLVLDPSARAVRIFARKDSREPQEAAS